MPLVSIFNIVEADILENKDCIFIYADNKKQAGLPFTNGRFRVLANAFPIIVKKSGGHAPESYWKDEEFILFKNELRRSLEVIEKILSVGTVGILCRESLDHYQFSVDTISSYSKEAKEHLLNELSSFYSRFTVKRK